VTKRTALNRQVVGSIPAASTIILNNLEWHLFDGYRTVSDLVQFEIQVQFGTAQADLGRLCFLQPYKSPGSVFREDSGYCPKGCRNIKVDYREESRRPIGEGQRLPAKCYAGIDPPTPSKITTD